ncbi:lactate utilization protein [Chloroflexota bacterium]
MVFRANKDIEMVMKSLKANRFAPVEFVEKAEAVPELVLDIIPAGATVRIAGSTTIRQLGFHERLMSRGTAVIDITQPGELSPERRRRLPVDVLLASSNAVTLDGKLVNIDMVGTRVANMIFGPKKVILVIGVNKIVRDVAEAIERIKNTIAPYHAMSLGRKMPCAINGRCTDCQSPDRICNVTTIIEKKPSDTDIAIVVVGEDLGLGWDPGWPKERKDRIWSVHLETTRAMQELRSAAHHTN